jgi:uroporphyrinogen decarboxylase
MAIIEKEFLDLTGDLDTGAFWAENELCWLRTPAKPRCPLSFSPDDHWLFGFLGVSDTIRYYRDKPWRDGLHAEANRILKEYVGRTWFGEDTWETQPRRIENLFRCEFAYTQGQTPWLVPATGDPKRFAAILDEAEKTDVRAWALPDDFRKEWDRRKKNGEILPRLGTGSRGPATVMTSILSPETFFYWTADHPRLLARFRDILAVKMIELNSFLRNFSGAQDPGWWITDDNCALFSPGLYEEYCFPVLKEVLAAFAPGNCGRYQHSDSSMAHLLGLQHRLGINSVNYGPAVDAGLIREKMPEAWIQGQLPPFLLRNGTPAEIEERVAGDFRKAGTGGALEIATAGSLAAGTGVGRMRWLMKVVRDRCRYGQDRGPDEHPPRLEVG